MKRIKNKIGVEWMKASRKTLGMGLRGKRSIAITSRNVKNSYHREMRRMNKAFIQEC